MKHVEDGQDLSIKRSLPVLTHGNLLRALIHLYYDARRTLRTGVRISLKVGCMSSFFWVIFSGAERSLVKQMTVYRGVNSNVQGFQV
jgi:hypothetical protein